MSFDAQSSSFHEQGYAVFDRVLRGPLLDLLQDQCAAFVAREDARMDVAGTDRLGLSHRGARYFANECQREQPALRTMLFAPVMADICRATLGADAYFFMDQYVVKGPEQGMAFSWHQDSGYVAGNGGPADHPPYLTCWCTLDDATVKNGTVRVVPGSHRRGLIAHERQEATADLGVAVPEDGQAIEVAAGSIVAFSSLLLHATGTNLSDHPRRVYLAQYTPRPLLNADGHLRRNAIAFLRNGEQVTFG
ncbi:phytanoyl-CoA dioxygenase family protein [Sphingobium sp.]|uniref:phytanoyl-CoA dioxygenase family protein n=1 Tax=Sphingobium sp. TaxID=1912891 RepID=UPI002B88D033|nr:phytanoyl-CoA dioxygenase family protein [Sphingobium sp.]HUD90491.1 phytanoyl-CoA dioxygenase family protein [Sphingobium sp.]